MQTLFEAGAKIIRKLNERGFEAFFVGGCVRDFYMARDIQDVDITTDAKPEEVESLFEKTIDVGKVHGTIIVMAEGTPFEVTTYRTDGIYTDHRHPDEVIFSNRLNEDLKRRDFTMNAMAMAEDYTFHDPYEGREAIEKCEITTVGYASDRFGEDALRMVRALRFMSVLDFGIEEETGVAMTANAHLMKHVSVERIVTEFKKMYNGVALDQAKVKLVRTGLARHIPFFSEITDDDLLKSRVDDLLDELIVQVIRDPSLKGSLHHLKLSNKELHTVKGCAALHEALEKGDHPLEVSYSFDEDILERFAAANDQNHLTQQSSLLQKAQALKLSLPISSKKDLEVDGRDLMELYSSRSGPWIKECLNIIEREVLFGRLKNNHNDIIDWVKTHVKVESASIEIIE
ncbi:CCA tRNA nucleotidyltransferase [Lacicoccus alkaliphilus]|uniref:tRNA nucleotidyltransferase (CCA-adding enzyme) n=1 Tax=Lacicoccus alkaliphilus DSM 16010 TaxID=1123231 RepID=A0A1M7B8Z3_9BACL|nr:CCA tRNA nucleotidyltransferase [Salinicoccus alkaliphilus]SHL51356.1 tRNA nucleotidyltransferase (CCA-adding enzyme) [Salinicoccus alkaliphilus DSM 16010]